MTIKVRRVRRLKLKHVNRDDARRYMRDTARSAAGPLRTSEMEHEPCCRRDGVQVEWVELDTTNVLPTKLIPPLGSIKMLLLAEMTCTSCRYVSEEYRMRILMPMKDGSHLARELEVEL